MTIQLDPEETRPRRAERLYVHRLHEGYASVLHEGKSCATGLPGRGLGPGGDGVGMAYERFECDRLKRCGCDQELNESWTLVVNYEASSSNSLIVVDHHHDEPRVGECCAGDFAG